MSVRVLLSVATEELRGRTLAVFAELGPEYDVVGVAETSNDLLLAIDAAEELDVVVIDDQIGSLPYLSLIRDVVARAPDIAVLVMSDEPTIHAYQDVMEAGGRALLDAPPSHDELVHRLPGILEWQRHVRMLGGQPLALGGEQPGRLMAFTGAKGGVGTSTVALHIALLAAVSNPDRRVCLIDLDLQQRGIRQLVDLTARRTIVDLATIADALTGRNLDEATVVHKSGLHVLMAPQHGEQAEELDSANARQIVAAAKGHFDLVVIDAGSVVTEAAAVGMEFADRLVMVATPDVACVRATQDKVDLLTRLQIAKDEDVHLLFNKVSPRHEVQPEFASRMTSASPLSSSLPEDWARLERVANALAPLDLDDGPFRRAMLALGRELRLALPEVRSPLEDAPSPKRKGRRRREDGQATIEAIVGISFALVLALVLIQVLMIAVASVTSRRAVDAAARVGERGGTMTEARQAAEAVSPGFFDIDVARIGAHDYRVTVTPPTILPPFNREVTAEGTAAWEGQ